MRRRSKVEGWAQEMSDPEEALRSSFLERIGDNNKLWVAVVIAVCLVALFVHYQAKQGSVVDSKHLYNPPTHRPGSSYDDSKHAEFARSFVKSKASGGKVLQARFVGAQSPDAEDSLIIVLAGDASADDIEHISKMAAQKNLLADFKTRIKVIAYQKDAASSTAALVATTSWSEEHYGFVTTFARHNE